MSSATVILRATYRLHYRSSVSGEAYYGKRIPHVLRLSGRLEVACKPDGGIGTKPKFVDHSVPLAVDVPEVHRVVPSRLVPVRTLRFRTGVVEVTGCEVLNRCFELILAVKKRADFHLKKPLQRGRKMCAVRDKPKSLRGSRVRSTTLRGVFVVVDSHCRLPGSRVSGRESICPLIRFLLRFSIR